MDLAQLEVFLSVARERRFSRAAEDLSHPIGGQPDHPQARRRDRRTCIDRSSRDGSLTDAGRVLLEYAEELLNVREDARRR